MTVQITRENFTAAMRDAVAERGEDFVYPAEGSELAKQGWRSEEGTCVYVLPDGSPACLIGLALYKIDPGLLTHVEFQYDDASRVMSRAGVQDSVLLRAADMAQYRQDVGAPWGEALSEYERALRTAGDVAR